MIYKGTKFITFDKKNIINWVPAVIVTEINNMQSQDREVMFEHNNSALVHNNNVQQNCRHPGNIQSLQDGQHHREGSLFQCISPYVRQMQHEEIRRNTYESPNWPVHLRTLSAAISKAGFYYLGERDKTKCFYCNGGLQNWEADQDPWVEHSKWYPDCEYLLANKGLGFVSHVATQFPNLRRPTYNHRPPNTPTGSKTLQDKINEIISSELLTEVKQFGFSNVLLRKVVEAKVSKGEAYRSVSEIVDDVLATESSPHDYAATIYQQPDSQLPNYSPYQTNLSHNQIESDNSVNVPSSSNDQLYFNSINSLNIEEQEKRLQDLKDEQRCKICLDEEMNCVFLPCNHLCCCENCAKSLRHCPICRVKLTKIIKIYRT